MTVDFATIRILSAAQRTAFNCPVPKNEGLGFGVWGLDIGLGFESRIGSYTRQKVHDLFGNKLQGGLPHANSCETAHRDPELL